MKKNMSIILVVSLILALVLAGCKKNSIGEFESAINKNNEINYSKQETTIKAELMGMEFNLSAKGESNKKDNTSAFKVIYNSNVEENLRAEMDIYKNSGSIYIKDKASKEYLKSQSQSQIDAITAASSIGDLILSSFKEDTEFEKSFTIEDGENKKVTATISDDGFNSEFKKIIDNVDMFVMIEEAMSSQLISMAETSSEVTATKEQIMSAAKQEAKAAVNAMKEQFKALKLTNIKYSGTIDKNGYLLSEEFRFSLIEPSTSLSAIVSIKLKQSDINSEAKIKIPDIPKDKIVEVN
ncbi:MAG: hypothetical protein RSA01_03490 [Clostridium sp.]